MNKLPTKPAIRLTSSRKDVIDCLRKAESAISHAELEQLLGERFDRVTLYRNLDYFEKKLMVHKVIDHKGIARYALCSDKCEVGHMHFDNHIHFSCVSCGKTFCMEDSGIPPLSLSKKFKVERVQLLVSGKCPSC